MPNYIYHFGTRFGWLNPEGGRCWGQGEIIFLEALGHSNSMKTDLFVFDEQRLVAIARSEVHEVHRKFARNHTKYLLNPTQLGDPLYTAYSIADGIAGRHNSRGECRNWERWLELSQELEAMVLESLKEQLK